MAAQMPDFFEVVAAADPVPARVEKLRQLSRNPAFRGFAGDRELLAAGKIADIVVIGTQDAYHVAPCIAAMETGYDILLEKPVATNIAEVLKLEQRAVELNRKVLVCHVLRYSPFYTKVREIIDSGILGEIVTLNAVEGVGAWHQTHSFVRGHWAVTQKSSPMIIAKSCHDMDLIAWYMGVPCRRISSHGALTWFTAANAPAGAPARCTDGCPAGLSCPYNALRYLGPEKAWLSYVFDRAYEADDGEIRQWLSKSPWGRCVYRCDNTAVDHEVVSMEFENAATATFTMTAFEDGRHIEICGTKARLRGGEFVKHASRADIIVTEHASRAETRFCVGDFGGGYGGHGGADAGLVRALYGEMIKSDPKQMRSSITQSVESHVMGFAAEESRLTGNSVVLDEFRKRHSPA